MFLIFHFSFSVFLLEFSTKFIFQTGTLCINSSLIELRFCVFFFFLFTSCLVVLVSFLRILLLLLFLHYTKSLVSVRSPWSCSLSPDFWHFFPLLSSWIIFCLFFSPKWALFLCPVFISMSPGTWAAWRWWDLTQVLLVPDRGTPFISVPGTLYHYLCIGLSVFVSVVVFQVLLW